MALEHVGYVDLPPRAEPGGFDHAAVHDGRGQRGAHTIGFDAVRNTVYAFLPDTHRAAVYRDQPGSRRTA